nr:hypothetical protein [Yersinia pestis]
NPLLRVGSELFAVKVRLDWSTIFPELILQNSGFALSAVTNGAIVIHTQRLKSDPGGNLLS